MNYQSKTVKRGNCTIVIHRPELNEKERNKRESAVLAALAQFGKRTYSRETQIHKEVSV